MSSIRSRTFCLLAGGLDDQMAFDVAGQDGRTIGVHFELRR